MYMTNPRLGLPVAASNFSLHAFTLPLTHFWLGVSLLRCAFDSCASWALLSSHYTRPHALWSRVVQEARQVMAADSGHEYHPAGSPLPDDEAWLAAACAAFVDATHRFQDAAYPSQVTLASPFSLLDASHTHRVLLLGWPQPAPPSWTQPPVQDSAYPSQVTSLPFSLERLCLTVTEYPYCAAFVDATHRFQDSAYPSQVTQCSAFLFAMCLTPTEYSVTSLIAYGPFPKTHSLIQILAYRVFN